MIVIEINVVPSTVANQELANIHDLKMRIWEALKGASYVHRVKVTAATGIFFGHLGESLPYLHAYFTRDELSNLAGDKSPTDCNPQLTVFNDCMSQLPLLGMNVLSSELLFFLSGH